ncbi:MAG: hypothetical protein AB7D36_08990 [Oscillospiraceae bacterium]
MEIERIPFRATYSCGEIKEADAFTSKDFIDMIIESADYYDPTETVTITNRVNNIICAVLWLDGFKSREP